MLIVIGVTVGADVNVLKEGFWEKESDGKVAVGAVFCVYASLSGSSNHVSIFFSRVKASFQFPEALNQLLPLPAISPLSPPA